MPITLAAVVGTASQTRPGQTCAGERATENVPKSFVTFRPNILSMLGENWAGFERSCPSSPALDRNLVKCARCQSTLWPKSAKFGRIQPPTSNIYLAEILGKIGRNSADGGQISAQIGGNRPDSPTSAPSSADVGQSRSKSGPNLPKSYRYGRTS